MNEMTITNAEYVLGFNSDNNDSIKATIDGVQMSVPLCEGNRYYDEIMRRVDAGTLTIADAE